MSFKSTILPETDQQAKELSQQQLEVPVHKGARKNWVKFAVRALVTSLFLAFLLKSVSWSTLFTTLAHAQHTWLLMGLALGVLCLVFSSYEWHCLVLAERIHTDLARLINLYLVGIAFSHFLPSNMGGDVAKAFYVGRDSGNMAGATSSVMLSRIIGFLGMLLIALPSLLIWHSWFTSRVIVGFLLLSLLLIVLISGTMIISVCLPKASSRLLKSRWIPKCAVITAVEVGQTLSTAVRKPRSLTIAILFSILFWIASFLNYYGYAVALGIHVPLFFYIIAIPFSSLFAFLPVSINGFGVREGALVYVFSTIHVSSSTSLLLAFLVDTQMLLFGVIGGCIYLSMGNHVKQ
jgi:glycosyltransferase 2 family protein